MNKLDELNDKQSRVEIQAEVISVGPLYKRVVCNECGHKQMILAAEFKDKCSKCGATESEQFKVGIWVQDKRANEIKDDSGTAFLDLWKEDVEKYVVGDKIHLTDGWCRIIDGKTYISRGSSGQIRKIE